MGDDPQFETRAELEAWIRQRCRFPDPAPGARMRAVEDCRRVTLAHAHLLKEWNASKQGERQ